MHLKPTSHKHGADGEYLLGVGVGRHVAEAHAGETAAREVQGGDVAGHGVGVRPVVNGFVDSLGQFVQPACRDTHKQVVPPLLVTTQRRLTLIHWLKFMCMCERA